MNLGIHDGIAYYTGKGISTERHAHHALELIFGLDSSFDLTIGDHCYYNINACILLPNIFHLFKGPETHALFIFLDPELVLSEEIISRTTFDKHGVKIIPAISVPPSTDRIFDYSFFNEILSIDKFFKRSIEQDGRVAGSINYIKANLNKEVISSEDLASKAFLSKSRFAHLFKDEVGIPVRKYILWSRLQEAIIAVISGCNLTQAAHKAGFSDSAHLSRTFREMFGVSPSAVLKS